jgi:hypothetical protein
VLGRSWRWVREQFAFVAVLVATTVAFAYLIVEPRHPVRGTGAIAVVFLFAGLLRLVLPSAMVGLLAVRNRFIDVFCYLVFGGLILATDIRLLH